MDLKYKAFKTILIRTPLLSFNKIKRYFEEGNIKTILSNEIILEAIFLASPEFYQELKKCNHDISLKNYKLLLFSLTRYLARMSTRCTPFGLFSQCSVGTISNKTSFILSNNIKRRTRLDMMFMFELYNYIKNQEDVKSHSQYKINNTLYSINNDYRYIETFNRKHKRHHKLTAIKKNKYLKKIANSINKIATIDEWTKEIKEEEIAYEEVKTYISELVGAQFLINILEPNTVGASSFEYLLSRIKQMPTNHNYNYLNQIKELVTSLDLKPERPFEIYERITKIIQSNQIPFDRKYLFQVDSSREMINSTLNQKVVKELNTIVTFLNKITSKKTNTPLNNFKDLFYSHYGEMEVPLLDVLDPEWGIGYPINNQNTNDSPLLKGLTIPQENSDMYISLNKNELILKDKILKAIKNKKKVIELYDSDFLEIDQTDNELPSTIYILFEIFYEEKNDVLIKLNSIGSSAGNLIARFAYMDPKIEELTKEITTYEQESTKDYIVAEIVHQPDDRVGNILFRPHLRDYEIVYLANTDLAIDKIIKASDIHISIKNNKLVLTSKTLKKKILPRLTTAHNYSNSEIPLYRFLCDFQSQDNKYLLDIFKFLNLFFNYIPRIKYKNIIIFPESWIVNIEDIKNIILEANDTKLLSLVSIWKEELELPRYILLCDIDNELFIDLESCLSLRSFLTIVKNRVRIHLSEFIFTEKNVVCDLDSNGYRNELIMSLYKS